MPVITLLNQKGGVGKTSTTHHLAGTLAAEGRRVLLLDNDPQASLTQGFWGPVATAGLDPAATIAAIYAGRDPFPEQVIRPTGDRGHRPGSRLEAGDGFQRPQAVRSPARGAGVPPGVPGRGSRSLRPRPDRLPAEPPPVLVGRPGRERSPDRPPPARGLRRPGARASPGVGRPGRDGPNPRLHLLGFLLTMHNARLAVHRLYENLLREQYGPAVFETRVPYAADFKEAIAQRKPIAQYKPKGASAKAIKALADEVLDRLADARCIEHETGGRVMGKLDELMKASGGIAAESMGRPQAAAVMNRASAPVTASTPDRLQGVARSKNAAEIPLDKIDRDPDQPREEFEPESLDRLAESLRARGQLQPIRVRWDRGAGALHHRLRRTPMEGRQDGRVDDHVLRDHGRADLIGGAALAPARGEPRPRGPQADRAGQGVPGRRWISTAGRRTTSPANWRSTSRAWSGP